MEEKLDFEDANPVEIEGARALNSAYHEQFLRELVSKRRKKEVHERVVKPRLNLIDSILEIGTGTGTHLVSYDGLNYTGLEIDLETFRTAQRNSSILGVKPQLIKRVNAKKIPSNTSSFGNVFTVCTLHEMGYIERELVEIDRVLKPNGNFVAVERLCAAGESAQAIRNLKREPQLFESFFSQRGYSTSLDRFKASYFGENLLEGPQYNFFVFSAKKK